jgi:hypothetical protein
MQLVAAISEPGLSASMKLKIVREINGLRSEIARCKVEAARRKADALLAEPSSSQPV